jgi:hypothetical protein
MRVLILVDAQFAVHERALIERVVVGLAQEGIFTQVVLPKDRGLEESGFDLIAEPIWYADRGLALTQRIRATQVARQVAKDSDELSGNIDIVHVFGGSAWSMGRELARALGAGLVLDIWRAGLIDSAKGFHIEASDWATFLVPERSFEAPLSKAGLGQHVHLAQWGAQVAAEPAQIFRQDKNIAIVLMSSGRQKNICIAAFEGLADAIVDHPSAMIFANVEAVERAGLWARVLDRDLRDRFTIIDRSEDRRDLLLRCDLMVYPDTLHEERTLLLDAMGIGMAIIAGNDSHIAPIQDSSGTILVDRPSRNAWAQKLSACLADHETTRRAGLESRAYVTKNRRIANYITSIIDAYQAITPDTRPEESE